MATGVASPAPATQPGARPVASIRDVTHHYGKVRALDRISVDIPSGLMVGVIGPDGAGQELAEYG